jgi:hypothetical protein
MVARVAYVVVGLCIVLAGCLGGGGPTNQGTPQEPPAIIVEESQPVQRTFETFDKNMKYRYQKLPDSLQPKVRRAINNKGEEVQLGDASMPNRNIAVFYEGRWYYVSGVA